MRILFRNGIFPYEMESQQNDATSMHSWNQINTFPLKERTCKCIVSKLWTANGEVLNQHLYCSESVWCTHKYQDENGQRKKKSE